MAFATAVSTPVAIRKDGRRYDASAFDKSDKAWWEIHPHPSQEILLEEGEFMLEGPHGQRRIGRFTGRQRWVTSSFRAATIELYEIDTVVEMVGELPVIVGRRGARIPGTWWTSPQAVSE